MGLKLVIVLVPFSLYPQGRFTALAFHCCVCALRATEIQYYLMKFFGFSCFLFRIDPKNVKVLAQLIFAYSQFNPSRAHQYPLHVVVHCLKSNVHFWVLFSASSFCFLAHQRVVRSLNVTFSVRIIKFFHSK